MPFSTQGQTVSFGILALQYVPVALVLETSTNGNRRLAQAVEATLDVVLEVVLLVIVLLVFVVFVVMVDRSVCKIIGFLLCFCCDKNML